MEANAQENKEHIDESVWSAEGGGVGREGRSERSSRPAETMEKRAALHACGGSGRERGHG
jgi:hypothetical protein